LADKSNQLILEALHRAASEPAGAPLFTTRKTPGLFPGGATARPAADRCKQMGFLRPAPAGTPVNGDAEAYAITDKGLDFLLSELSPRQVLEGLARNFESRQAQVQAVASAARGWLEEMQPLRALVENTLRRLQTPERPEGRAEAGNCPWAAEALTLLDRWQRERASGDCPLPEFYRHLKQSRPALTIGSFHDGLRHMQEQQQIYLHPWTGPLYELPEPTYALMTGHEIAYYASRR
jgi:hypothetical protein